jgi:hypothetical protein
MMRARARLGVSFDAVSQALTENAEDLLPGIPEADGLPVMEISIRETVIERAVEFSVGEFTEVREPLLAGVIPFTIRAVHGTGRYPVFEGAVEVTTTGHSGVEVALEGRYRPPGGLFGAALDVTALHHMGLDSLERWFKAFAERLRVDAAARDSMSGVPV